MQRFIVVYYWISHESLVFVSGVHTSLKKSVYTKKIFPVFMWRNHIPKLNITFPSEALGLSDKRSYRNLTFHNVLARQGSSYCNRARLNFQAFALRDMKIATREGFRVGQKMIYHFSFC